MGVKWIGRARGFGARVAANHAYPDLAAHTFPATWPQIEAVFSAWLTGGG